MGNITDRLHNVKGGFWRDSLRSHRFKTYYFSYSCWSRRHVGHRRGKTIDSDWPDKYAGNPSILSVRSLNGSSTYVLEIYDKWTVRYYDHG